MSLLVVCERFGLLVDTLTANEKYAPCNSENFLQQIQMQLSKKQKTFCEYLAPFLKFTSKFEHFEKKKRDTHCLCISEITDSKRRPG